MVKPEDFDSISQKMKPDDVIKIVDEANTKNNPWAICRGQQNKVGKDTMTDAEVESCVLKMKKKYGIGENITEDMYDGEDYERASREVEYGINPETGADWDSLLGQLGDEEFGQTESEITEDDTTQVNPDKLKSDVQKFMDKLNLGQFDTILAKIDKPAEQAEIVAAFAERIGIPRAKLPSILQSLRTVATESVRPKMKKSTLINEVLKINNKK
jgi:hypothetical protein